MTAPGIFRPSPAPRAAGLSATVRAAVTVEAAKCSIPQFLFGNRNPDATNGKLSDSTVPRWAN